MASTLAPASVLLKRISPTNIQDWLNSERKRFSYLAYPWGNGAKKSASSLSVLTGWNICQKRLPNSCPIKDFFKYRKQWNLEDLYLLPASLGLELRIKVCFIRNVIQCQKIWWSLNPWTITRFHLARARIKPKNRDFGSGKRRDYIYYWIGNWESSFWCHFGDSFPTSCTKK